MPYRTFVDTAAIEWQVWDVVPRLSERRSGEVSDRRVEVVPISFADRRAKPRRVTQARKAFLRGTYAQGWLCFDSSREKRRLTPIPGDWTTCSEELLEVYSRHAKPVAAPYRSFSFSDDESMAEAG